MTSINSVYDEGYSQYLRTRKICAYCSRTFATAITLGVHRKKFHDKEIARY